MIQLRATQLKADVRTPEVEGRLGVVSGRSRTTAFGQHRTLSEVENERLDVRSQTTSSRSAANRCWGGDVLQLSFLLAQHHMLGQSTRYRVTLRLPTGPRGLLANGCILNVSDLTLRVGSYATSC